MLLSPSDVVLTRDLHPIHTDSCLSESPSPQSQPACLPDSPSKVKRPARPRLIVAHITHHCPTQRASALSCLAPSTLPATSNQRVPASTRHISPPSRHALSSNLSARPETTRRVCASFSNLPSASRLGSTLRPLTARPTYPLPPGANSAKRPPLRSALSPHAPKVPQP